MEVETRIPQQFVSVEQPAGRPKNYVVQVEPAFFIDGHWCKDACAPERWNPLRLRGGVRLNDLRARLTITDITTPGKDVPIKPAGPVPTRTYVVDACRAEGFSWITLDLEDQSDSTRSVLQPRDFRPHTPSRRRTFIPNRAFTPTRWSPAACS